MLATAFHFRDFGVAIAVGLLGELGDKTFFVLLVLALWCPWQGIRDSNAAPLERCLVFLGGSIALLARLIVLAYVPRLRSTDCWFDVASGCVLLILGLRALIERRILGPEPKAASEESPIAGDLSSEIPADTKWNQAAFSWLPSVPRNPFAADGDADDSVPHHTEWNKSAFPTVPMPAADAEQASPGFSSYGTTSAPPTSANGILSERISDSLASQIMAAPLAFVLLFVIQADDKSEEELMDFGRPRLSTVLGAWLGFMIATGAAVLLGAFTQWGFFSKRQILVAVIFVLLSMSLVSFSQALLHLSSLQPPAKVS